MPIQGQGWELFIERLREERRGSPRRTVGRYQVFHGGTAVRGLSGTCVETRGPGDNSRPGNNRRIEAGRYPLLTQDGAKYVTIGYRESESKTAKPKPGLELGKTGRRSEILIHPGISFMASVGCINPTARLAGPDADIDFVDSRKRVIAIINDLKTFLGAQFPSRNGRPIANAFVVVEGEPTL